MLKRYFFLIFGFFGALEPLGAMDISIKKEPYIPPRELYPVITPEHIQDEFSKNTFNPERLTDNCVDAAIKCLKWLDRTKEAQPSTKNKKSGANIAVYDEAFAELLREEDNIKLASKIVRINIEDNSSEPLLATFDGVVLKAQGKFKLLADYLKSIPLKSSSHSSGSYRAGLLYLVNKRPANTGHMVVFYKFSKDNITTDYILDPQRGTKQDLKTFIQKQGRNFLNFAYIWYDKGDFEIPVEFKRSLIKIEDHKDPEIVIIEDLDTEGLVQGALANDEQSQTQIISLLKSSDRKSAINILATLLARDSKWAFLVIRDHLDEKDAGEGLAEAIIKDSVYALSIVESMAEDDSDRPNTIAMIALFLAADNNSLRAQEAIETLAVKENSPRAQKTASRALANLLKEGGNPRADDFIDSIAPNPTIKTAFITIVHLIDTSWGQNKIEKYIGSDDPNLLFGISMVLGGAASKNNQYAMDKILNAKNNGINFEIIAATALRRAADLNSLWAQNKIIEFAGSKDIRLRDIVFKALVGTGLATPWVQKIIEEFAIHGNDTLKELAILILRQGLINNYPWAQTQTFSFFSKPNLKPLAFRILKSAADNHCQWAQMILSQQVRRS